MILSHYNDNARWSFAVRDCVQRQDAKPGGLWVSIDGAHDWPSWCHAESFRLNWLRFRHVFELHPSQAERVLHITDPLGIDMLTQRFGYDVSGLRCFIDWPQVARRWAGVIIAPYQWSRRLEGGAPWYYGWDCASGCIWDTSVLRHVSSGPFDVVAHVEAEATHAV